MTLFAGALLMISGVFHAGAWAFLGWNRTTMALIAIGVIYAALSLVVLRRRRWWMIVAAILTLLDAAGAFLILYDSDLPSWLTLSFIACDLVIALALALELSYRRDRGRSS